MDTDIDKWIRRYYRTRSAWRRRLRIIFPSPLELKFIELMGGRVVRFTKLKQRRTGFPAAIVTNLGPVLRGQNVKREVRYGKYFVDFANDLDRIIELDGAAWHTDVVADMDREIYIKDMCRRQNREARILRLKAYEVYNNPTGTQNRVLKHLD